jgi:hypothetical protein
MHPVRALLELPAAPRLPALGHQSYRSPYDSQVSRPQEPTPGVHLTAIDRDYGDPRCNAVVMLQRVSEAYGASDVSAITFMCGAAVSKSPVWATQVADESGQRSTRHARLADVTPGQNRLAPTSTSQPVRYARRALAPSAGSARPVQNAEVGRHVPTVRQVVGRSTSDHPLNPKKTPQGAARDVESLAAHLASG